MHRWLPSPPAEGTLHYHTPQSLPIPPSTLLDNTTLPNASEAAYANMVIQNLSSDLAECDKRHFERRFQLYPPI